MISIGNVLKALREDSGKSQMEVCKTLNIEQSTLANYENNKRIPKIDILVNIAKFYNVTVDYILGVESKDYEWKLPYIENRFTTIIKELEKTLCVSTKELADNLQISEETLYDFMIGKSIPSLDFLEKMSAFYHIGLDYLIGSSYKSQIPITKDGNSVDSFLFDITFRSRFEVLCLSKNITSMNSETTIGLTHREFIDISYNRMPSLYELLIISYFFNVSLDYLMGKTDIPSNTEGGMNSDEKRLLNTYRFLSMDDKAILIGKSLELKKDSSSVAADDRERKVSGK